MITDNLAPLFDQGQPGVRFRQGTILTWDPSTGENTVDLAGGTLTNVPILNTGEAIALKAGHIVALLGQGAAWFIIGRVTPPNDPNFAGASVAFASGSDWSQGFGITQTMTTKATVTLAVPSWADEAAVIATSTASVLNTRNPASGDYCFAWVLIDGETSIVSGHGYDGGAVSYQAFQNLTANYSTVVSNPGSTISVQAQLQSNGGAWPADLAGSNRCSLSAVAIFRSIV